MSNLKPTPEVQRLLRDAFDPKTRENSGLGSVAGAEESSADPDNNIDSEQTSDCPSCGAESSETELEANGGVCEDCGEDDEKGSQTSSQAPPQTQSNNSEEEDGDADEEQSEPPEEEHIKCQNCSRKLTDYDKIHFTKTCVHCNVLTDVAKLF